MILIYSAALLLTCVKSCNCCACSVNDFSGESMVTREVASALTSTVWVVAPTARLTLMLRWARRSEEHTSELQSQSNLVCRLLLEKKKKKKHQHIHN